MAARLASLASAFPPFWPLALHLARVRCSTITRCRAFAAAASTSESEEAQAWTWPAKPAKSRQFRQAQRAAEHRAAGQVTKPVFRALHKVWSTLPMEAKEAISKAGFEAKPNPPPGLPAAGGQTQGGVAKGRVAFVSEGGGDKSQAEAVKSLFCLGFRGTARASHSAGILQPPVEPPLDLAALCKQHISSLPEDIRKLVEEPPEKPPAPQEVMSEKSKQFKVAAADLRDLIFKKSALQLRLNKHKETVHLHVGGHARHQ